MLFTWFSLAADLEVRPNFVVVITDDQRFDTLWAMASVQQDLVEPGVVFERAYVSTPLCCPFRASLLSGGFPSRETGVLSNEGGNGGPSKFADTETLATRFQEAGYATGLIGKYLTNYDTQAPRIPPGWTRFEAITSIETWWDHQALVGSSGSQADEGVLVDHTDYITTVQRDGALAFVDEHADEPFLLFLTLASPHQPWTPLPIDEGSHADVLHRPPSFNEEDVTDKPPWLQEGTLLGEPEIAEVDVQVRSQLDCLLSIDRAVQSLVESLEQHGLLEQTHVIFTSDNGMMWGEHRQTSKGMAYEEAARVPLAWRGPQVVSGSLETAVLVDLDLPATLAELAGLTPHTGGVSLLPLLQGQAFERGPILVENLAPVRFPSWSALVDGMAKLVSWSDGFEELYDLELDPYELDNLVEEPDRSEQLASLRASIEADRGLTMPPQELPAGQVGETYEGILQALGGQPPYVWTALDHLPADLVLDTEGNLGGSPTIAGTWEVSFQVEDGGTSPQTGLPHHFQRRFTLEVVAARAEQESETGGCGCGSLSPGGAGMGWLFSMALWMGRRGPRPPRFRPIDTAL